MTPLISCDRVLDKFGGLGIAVLTVLLASCASDLDSQPNVVLSAAPGRDGDGAFSLELDQVFGGDENSADLRSLLGRVGSAAVHESGDVYVLDAQGNDIVAFNPDGSVKWRKGEQGEGPGEIQWASKLFLARDGLVLVNQGGSRLDRFDLSGEYQSAILNRARLSPDCVLPDGRLLGDEAISDQWKIKVQTTQNAFELDSVAVLFDTTFEYDQPAGRGAAIAVTACTGNEILIVNPGAYLIDRYSVDGSYLGSFGRSDIGWGPPLTVTDGASVTVPQFLPHAPLRLGHGGFFVTAQWLKNPEIVPEIASAMLKGQTQPTRKWQYSLDLYGPTGTLLSSITGDDEPPIGRPVASIGENAIYTYVNSPVPQVRRYNLVAH